MENARHVLVAGAGAAGMMAAVTAARAGCRVTILERTARSGRKIEITGNGKCNFTNADQRMSYYHTQTPAYLEGIFAQFGYRDTLRFFEEIGIVSMEKRGCYYPYSGQAKAVSAALRREAERLKVRFASNISIKQIQRKSKIVVNVEGYQYEGDALILATGSMAAPSTGSDGSGYALAKSLGHRVRKPLPALVQLLCRDREIAVLAGLRTEAGATLYINEKACEAEEGEVQFVKNGLSGIPVFQLSGHAARALDKKNKCSIKINFLKGLQLPEERTFLEERRNACLERGAALQDFFNGILHEKAAKAVLNRLKKKGSLLVEQLSDQEWEKMCDLLTEMEFVIDRANSFEQAQVCSGGVVLDELKEGTMESAIVKDLYFAGEILDVDGACGGYNLQWAWSSGYVAGLHAAKG